MSVSTLQGAEALAVFAAGVALVSMLQADDRSRVSTPAKHYFSTYITTRVAPGFHAACCPGP